MSSQNTGTNFEVRKQDLHQVRWVDRPAESLEPKAGQVLLRIDRFAFTANNVTYAVFGDAMSYWDFFPAEAGWGRIPVWGFGDVVGSSCDDLAEGERVYGFFPMSTHLVVRPQQVGPGSFIDGAPHRQERAPIYNQYLRVAGDPSYEARYEDPQLLFRPLFMTAFLLDDFLTENDFFGGRAVVLSSASSKTAISLAFLLSRGAGDRREVIGLTARRNLSFVRGLGCYDRVVAYDEINSLSPTVPVAFVDMAGDGEVGSALHHHLRENLVYDCMVGATHWERTKREEGLPGAQPQLFFAPAQAQKRSAELGAAELQERTATAWRAFLQPAESWVRVVEGRGKAAVERVYRETLEGRSKPDEGHLLTLRDAGGSTP